MGKTGNGVENALLFVISSDILLTFDGCKGYNLDRWNGWDQKLKCDSREPRDAKDSKGRRAENWKTWKLWKRGQGRRHFHQSNQGLACGRLGSNGTLSHSTIQALTPCAAVHQQLHQLICNSLCAIFFPSANTLIWLWQTSCCLIRPPFCISHAAEPLSPHRPDKVKITARYFHFSSPYLVRETLEARSTSLPSLSASDFAGPGLALEIGECHAANWRSN